MVQACQEQPSMCPWLGSQPPEFTHPQDVSAKRSLELPELYMAGQKDKLFNYWVFFQSITHGAATSLINFFMTLSVSHGTAEPLSFSNYQSFSEVVAISCLLSVTIEVAGLLSTPPLERGLGHRQPRSHHLVTLPGRP